MLVSSMTTEEVYREIMRDFENVRLRSYIEGMQFQREMIRRNQQQQTSFSSYKTPMHNTWNMIFKISSKGIETSFYLKNYDNRSIVAYRLAVYFPGSSAEKIYIYKYDSHFFERYNERMGLQFNERSKVIDHFFCNNIDHSFATSDPVKKNISSARCMLNGGMGVGWSNEQKGIYLFKTFVSEDMFTKNQQNIIDIIASQRKKKKIDVSIKRNYLRQALRSL